MFSLSCRHADFFSKFTIKLYVSPSCPHADFFSKFTIKLYISPSCPHADFFSKFTIKFYVSPSCHHAYLAKFTIKFVCLFRLAPMLTLQVRNKICMSFPSCRHAYFFTKFTIKCVCLAPLAAMLTLQSSQLNLYVFSRLLPCLLLYKVHNKICMSFHSCCHAYFFAKFTIKFVCFSLLLPCLLLC